MRDTARQIFERDLLADTKVVADTQLEPDYVQLVSNRDTNERYYSLEGKWVPPEVAVMLHQESKARERDREVVPHAPFNVQTDEDNLFHNVICEQLLRKLLPHADGWEYHFIIPLRHTPRL